MKFLCKCFLMRKRNMCWYTYINVQREVCACVYVCMIMCICKWGCVCVGVFCMYVWFSIFLLFFFFNKRIITNFVLLYIFFYQLTDHKRKFVGPIFILFSDSYSQKVVVKVYIDILREKKDLAVFFCVNMLHTLAFVIWILLREILQIKINFCPFVQRYIFYL